MATHVWFSMAAHKRQRKLTRDFRELTIVPDKKKSLLLRINTELWNDLNTWAKDELRSVNAQIEYILRAEVHKRKKRRRSEED
jgi:hypothetical protein